MTKKGNISLPAESENLDIYLEQYSDYSAALAEVGRVYIAGLFDDLHTAGMEALDRWLETADIPNDIKNLIHFLPMIEQVKNDLCPREGLSLDSDDYRAVIGVLVPFK